jgi:hypothetical protein
MDLGALAWVERNNKIMIEGGDGNTISFKGLTYKLVTKFYAISDILLKVSLNTSKTGHHVITSFIGV